LLSEQLAETSCLISDIQMPEMSGIELHDILRTGGHHTPIIFITAFPDEKAHAQALVRGAVCFLSKPFDGNTLCRCIFVALKNSAGESD
jgi:FixJ family two-component response regulator